ncbi:ribonuclease H protein, partial [Trifolium medium]|nr:ribonuclease H protein [Trifolium medium]
MNRAVELQRFNGFSFGGDDLVISHLQYADDTLFIGEATTENLWVIKAILRAFEMASGLRVNFHKSCLMGVNVSNEFMNMGAEFLNCRLGSVPFKYLGLPVGANPRRLVTWQPLLNTLQNKLSVWGNRYVSLGGRLILLNSVLSAIPIFFLSYMKMPVIVWKEVVKIQRKFLWGGVSDRKRISWVKWETICLPKREGGLGVRDLRIVNTSLLAKWRWRLLQNEDAMWSWSCDVRSVGGEVAQNLNWFSSSVSRTVSNGRNTRFWLDKWTPDGPLMLKFPHLFSLSRSPEATIGDMGNWLGEAWFWDFTWRRNLFVWEENQFHSLLSSLRPLVNRTGMDSWRWEPDPEGVFSARSVYSLLVHRWSLANLTIHQHKEVLALVWTSKAPMK